MPKKKSTIEKTPESAFAERVLPSLIVDVVAMESQAKRVRVQVAALAKQHGIKMPAPEDVE